MSAETRDVLEPFERVLAWANAKQGEHRQLGAIAVLLELAIREARQHLSAPPRASEGKEGAGND